VVCFCTAVGERRAGATTLVRKAFTCRTHPRTSSESSQWVRSDEK
jgi:hypothetical protein